MDTEASCLAPLTFASHAYDRFHLLMPLYVCRVWRGEPLPREGQALRWAGRNCGSADAARGPAADPGPGGTALILGH